MSDSIRICWNDGKDKTDVTVSCRDREFAHVIESHFSHGVVTFHTGYLFRKSPQSALLAGGAPNHVKDGIQAFPFHYELDHDPTGHCAFQKRKTVLFYPVDGAS